jgi:hypothetical protein
MRRLRLFVLTTLFSVCILAILSAQTPGFNYQAVLRDAQGQPLANQDITLRIGLTDGMGGDLLYQESHDITTNDLGLINVTIGSGLLESGAFQSIVGVADLYYEIEAGLPDGSNETLGVGPVGAIPYALYGEDEDSDPSNEMQDLLLEGDSLGIVGGTGVSLKAFDGPWEPLEDTSGYILNFPPEIPSARNAEFIAFLIRCFTNGANFSLVNGDYKISSGLRVGMFNDEKYPDIPVANDDYAGASTSSRFTVAGLDDSRTSLSRNTVGYYLNPAGNSLFVNSRKTGITLGTSYQLFSEDEGQFGGDCEIEDTDYNLNYRMGFKPTFLNFGFNYNFAGIGGSFEGVSSNDPNVPLVSGTDYSLSDAAMAGLNSALEDNSGIDFYKSKAPFGDRGIRTDYALANNYLSIANTWNKDDYSSFGGTKYFDSYSTYRTNQWSSLSGTNSTTLYRALNLQELFVGQFSPILLGSGVEPMQEAYVRAQRQFIANDTTSGFIDIYATAADNTRIHFITDYSNFTLDLNAGAKEIFGSITEDGTPIVRRVNGTAENNDYYLNFSDWNNTENEFGAGISVNSPISFSRKQANYGGTFSTANNLGLSALVGSIPGFDPTVPVFTLFRGQNPVIFSSLNGAGSSQTMFYGANGLQNLTISHIVDKPNGGGVFLYGEQGDAVLGSFYVDEEEKTILQVDEVVFLSEPAGRSDEAIAYGALSGGESGAYDRGTGQLINGEAYIQCPQHFQQIADPASMTVTITPLSADSKGIAVVEKTPDGFRVKELFNGTGNYAFDYMVTCKRKGYESFEVNRKRVEPAQSMDLEPILRKVAGKKLSSVEDIDRFVGE